MYQKAVPWFLIDQIKESRLLVSVALSDQEYHSHWMGMLVHPDQSLS
jgi:hypothetical protein